MIDVLMFTLGHSSPSDDAKKQMQKDFDNTLKTLDNFLEDKSFLVGNSLTVADVVVACYLSAHYQITFDAKVHAKYENLCPYLERILNLPSVVRRFGYMKKPFADSAPVAAEAAPAKKEAAADDDDLDLFGDDDEEDAEAAKKAAAKAKEAAAGKKKKKEVIAMSLVMLEVKPLDSETNLDELAQRIFKTITKEGLFWKTEYKKEPIAFGIEKLIIGFSCEDEKISVDNDVVEKIEEIEDLVQSVEITAFNKI